MRDDPLLEPFQLRHLRLKNRIISTGHEPACLAGRTVCSVSAT